MKTTWHIVTVCIVLAGLAACSSGTPKEPGMASSAPRGVTMHEPGVYKGDKDDLIAKMQQAGVQVTRPNLGLFRAAMKPAYDQIAQYAGAENVKKLQEYIEAARKK